MQIWQSSDVESVMYEGSNPSLGILRKEEGVSDKYDVLACAPVEKTRQMGVPYTPPPEHTEFPCMLCRHPMWIGPKSKTLVTEGKMIAVCAFCLIPIMSPGQEIKTLSESP
jgi:hypothetical protein